MVSIMPLSPGRQITDDRGMKNSKTVLVSDPHNPERLVLRSTTAWSQVRSHLFADSLDRQIAEGARPESNLLLASRAADLVAPEFRLALANDWRHMLEKARMTSAIVSVRRIPLCRDRIRDAEPQIEAMLAALSIPLPLPAQGVALASRLLTDGLGPLYSRESTVELRDAVIEATLYMDPTRSLILFA